MLIEGEDMPSFVGSCNDRNIGNACGSTIRVGLKLALTLGGRCRHQPRRIIRDELQQCMYGARAFIGKPIQTCLKLSSWNAC
jgi:hypothetical protein